MRKTDRYRLVLERFEESMPDPRTELHYDSPFHLLVAVILSAQCTDKRVNQITPPLFERFPTPASLAEATHEEVFGFVKSCSYPNNKTKSLIAMAQKLSHDFGGELPDDIDALLTLPGVGRKTANVILSVVFNRPNMAVDTHVFRVANRIGLTSNSRTPLASEKELVRYIPTDKTARAHHWLILHGRYVCKARKPLCQECIVSEWCRYNKENK